MLASIDPRPYQIQLARAEGQLTRDEAQLADAMNVQNGIPKQQLAKVTQLEGSIQADQANVDSASLAVEAWNRDDTAKIATGRLTAVDKRIDQTTRTPKLKAVFDNKDGKLFPNQLVLVRLFLNGQ